MIYNIMRNLHLLPQELIVEVLSHLPAESVFRFKCVCRTWRALLDDPYFAEIHTGKLPLHYDRLSLLVPVSAGRTSGNPRIHVEDLDYVDDDEQLCKSFSNNLTRPLPPPFDEKTYIIGSCNGLVCLARFGAWHPASSIFVYNPMTREHFKLPHADKSEYNAHWYFGAEGFGFHPITREYKVIRIHSERQSASNVWNVQIHIYTLGSGIWRIKQGLQTPYDASFPYIGVPFNGSVYWGNLLQGNIGFIDLEDEEFRIIPAPPLGPNSPTFKNCTSYGLLVLGGNLCIAERVRNGIDIWVVKNEKDSHQAGCSWTKNFNIPAKFEINQEPNTPNIAVTRSLVKPLLLTKSGKVVCMCARDTLISFDPKTQSCFLLKDYKKSLGNSRYIIYMKSIVSLKALGEEDVKMTVSISSTCSSRCS